jgi:hypothetical protein
VSSIKPFPGFVESLFRDGTAALRADQPRKDPKTLFQALAIAAGNAMKESRKLFASLRDMRPFLRSEAPGLVFSEEKNGGLPPVTSERPHAPVIPNVPCKQFDAVSSKCKYIFS